MTKKRPARTWLEVAVARVGLRSAVKAMTWAYQWAVAREALGHDPSVDEVADYWGGSRRTAFREQAAFRAAFPELEIPARLYHSEQARAALRKQAELGEKVEQLGAKRREREAEKGIARLGVPPSDP